VRNWSAMNANPEFLTLRERVTALVRGIEVAA
jgi:hypothetical protein